jgi:hypothetical protein
VSFGHGMRAPFPMTVRTMVKVTLRSSIDPIAPPGLSA